MLNTRFYSSPPKPPVQLTSPNQSYMITIRIQLPRHPYTRHRSDINSSCSNGLFMVVPPPWVVIAVYYYCKIKSHIKDIKATKWRWNPAPCWGMSGLLLHLLQKAALGSRRGGEWAGRGGRGGGAHLCLPKRCQMSEGKVWHLVKITNSDTNLKRTNNTGRATQNGFWKM